jgi:hypothetical protein
MTAAARAMGGRCNSAVQFAKSDEACGTVSVKNSGSVISLSGTTPNDGGSNGGDMDAVGSAAYDGGWAEFGEFADGWESAFVDPR